MLSQGALEQNSFASGYSRTNITNHGRTLETNTENLLRMVLHFSYSVDFKVMEMESLYNLFSTKFQVSYCENDVDCRRFLQLVHFGEKFDSGSCRKTCDNCSKVQSFVEKDCTLIAKQLVRKTIAILNISCQLLIMCTASVQDILKLEPLFKLL